MSPIRASKAGSVSEWKNDEVMVVVTVERHDRGLNQIGCASASEVPVKSVLSSVTYPMYSSQ